MAKESRTGDARGMAIDCGEVGLLLHAGAAMYDPGYERGRRLVNDKDANPDAAPNGPARTEPVAAAPTASAATAAIPARTTAA